MAISTANVNTTTDTFNDWVNKTNNVATIISNNCITANGSLSLTTGNSYLNGFFSANTLIAQDAIRGGNNTTANVLNISTGFVTSKTTYISNTVNFTDNVAVQVVDSFALASARTIKYLLQVNATAIGFQSTEIMLLHNGTDAFLTEYATLTSNTSQGNMAVFTVNVASGNVNLLISPTTNSTTTSTVNFQRTTIAV
jgi:hypothetical protein